MSKSKGFDINERENKKATGEDLEKMAGRMWRDHDSIGGAGVGSLVDPADHTGVAKRLKAVFRVRASSWQRARVGAVR